MVAESLQPVRVLLVDNNSNNLKVLAAAIQEQGWRALLATDRESAIAQTEEAHPDLILLDVMMPGLDGFEMCRRLKANPTTQNIAIIFMTALSELTDKVKGLESGAVDYITKPFQQEEVIARLKLHIKISQLTRTLEQRVEDRTVELTHSLHQLQQVQLQMIQSEKMSALGQLVAGIGHEINNPIGCVKGNFFLLEEYLQDFFRLLTLYQQKLPYPDAEITALTKEIDLDFLIRDLPKLVESMRQGVNRLQDISLSLRTFARSDISHKTEFQVHEGIESTLMLLKHRLRATERRPAIQVVRQYGELPPISCHPGQLNQVFINIIANAIDAFDDLEFTGWHGNSDHRSAAHPHTITITTAIVPAQTSIAIRIHDNGLGMTPEVQARIFEQSFTTKPVGKGTGLGLALSHQIVVEKHNGQLDCISNFGKGTEFVITLPI